MTRPRTFNVTETDARAPVLVQVLSHVIALQRFHGIHPKRIILNAPLYTVLALYIGESGRIDKLFNVPVTANLEDTAMPFTIVSEG